MARNKSGFCVLCGTWRKSLHRDHIIPKFKGGADTIDNIQLICANCHEDKTREDLTGHPLSPMARAAQSLAQTGRRHSPETIIKIKAGCAATAQTPEFREKMRLIMISNKIKCGGCDLITNAGALAMHQRKTKHEGRCDASI